MIIKPNHIMIWAVIRILTGAPLGPGGPRGPIGPYKRNTTNTENISLASFILTSSGTNLPNEYRCPE